MIKMEGGQEAICVKTIPPMIGQKFLILKVKKVKCEESRMIRIDLF